MLSLKSFLARTFGHAFETTLAFCKRAGEIAFGQISWRPPSWSLRAAAGVGAGLHVIKRYPRRSFGVAGALLLSFSLTYLLLRWYENQPKPVEFEFSVSQPEITCYTCDPPGKPHPLIVTFAGSTAPIDRIGRALELTKAGIAFAPVIDGSWQWDDDRTLRFQPSVDWPIDTKFTLNFDDATFAAKEVRLATYRFEFRTNPFTAHIAGTEFYQDPVVARNKKIVTTVTFSHPLDAESIERRIKLKMFDRVTDKIEKELAVPSHTVVFDKLKLNAYIHTGEIEIPTKSGRLEITIESGMRATRGGNKIGVPLTNSITIPGINSLIVGDVSADIARDERNDPHQVLLVEMSATVMEKPLSDKIVAWLLPEKHPDPKLQESFERHNDGPFRWTPQVLKPEMLAKATRIELKQIPGEREHYELHSFRYSADPGRQLFVTVRSGLASFGGYVLGKNFEMIVDVPEYPRELSLLHEGSLLAMSGDKTLTLMSRNVPAIRVEIGRLLPKQLQHLVTQTSGSFAQPRFHNWAFEAANITESFTKTIRLAETEPGKAQYEALELGEYLHRDPNDRRGVFLIRVQAWDPEKDQPLDGHSSRRWNHANAAQLSDARLIVLTDLGILVKRSVDGTQDVFVQSLHTGRPVSGAHVSVIGLNGVSVLSETTDGEGHVRFGELKGLVREKKPVLYLAQLGGDSSFLPIDDRVRTLDLSRFDVGGLDNRIDRSALSAFLFSDRGIYRPGEQIRLAAIIRSQDWQQRLAGVPLRLEVRDPRGTVVRRETFVPGVAGFNEILHDTKESSPTGIYTFALAIVRNEYSSDLIGSTTVQVRDFLPDRLKLKVGFSAESFDGWVSPTNLQARIDLQNLFGTAAEKRRIATQMMLSPSFPSFRAYPDYRFFDPEHARESFNERLADLETDADGQASIDLNLKRFARATYRLHLLVEGFEADGGRGVTAEASQLVSNMPHLVGYKPDGSLSYLARNSQHSVDLIAIDPNAKRKALDKLTLARIEMRYVSVLLRQPNGTYKYESRRKETELTGIPLLIAEKGFKLDIDTSAPGTFAYAVRDADGQSLARIDYQVAGDANVTRKMDKNAELEIVLSKQDFSPGDEIEFSIRAPYAGAGLITIERDRVYSWRWFKTSTMASVQRIRVPENLEGNAYVTVTFVRDPASEEIYSSPLSQGVQPFSINLNSRRNALTLKAPSKVKPGENVTLRYQTAHPARIVLFAVDEGILQVARYETPKPLEFFFQKRALGVSTAQILDLLLPEFRRLGLSAAPGGDGERMLSQHLNPFRRKGEKPVAYWSGILDADSSPRETTFTVPDYFNGSLRLMAVAVSDASIGVFDEHLTIRGDFVLSPNAPTTVTPGDEFDVSVGVSNNVSASGIDAPIDVTLGSDPGLEIIGDARQQVRIGEGREGSVRFRVRARDQLGAPALMFSAKTEAGSGGSATRRIDLSLRPATPYMTQLTMGVLGTEERDVPLTRELYPHYRKLEAGISILPLGFAHGFVSYLSNYPYACTEQIVSQALPAIVLGGRPEFGYVRTQPGANVVALLSELRSRQNDDGAYKLWPGGDLVVEFVSLYAQHALIEATDRGERIPGDIVLRGNVYLRKIAARDGDNLVEERNSAFAIYLLARQAQMATAELAALRKRLNERYKKEWTSDLTALWLAATYDILKNNAEASRLLRGVRFTDDAQNRSSYDVYFDPMTHDALLLWITAKHFPERLSNLSPSVLNNLATRVNRGMYMSLSSGTTLLALDAYVSAGATHAQLSLAEIDRKDRSVKPLVLSNSLFPKATISEQASALRLGNESQWNAYYLIEQSGFDKKPPTTALREGMEVIREYSDSDGKALTKITMGQEILVHLKFRGINGRRTGNVALVDLLPGGFELVIPSQPAAETHASATLGATSATVVSGGESRGGIERNTHSGATFNGWYCQLCVGGSYPTLQYADMREDRVVFYVDTNDTVQEIVYRIKATNVGRFISPPAYGEAMYDRSVFGRSVSGLLEVVRQ